MTKSYIVNLWKKDYKSPISSRDISFPGWQINVMHYVYTISCTIYHKW